MIGAIVAALLASALWVLSTRYPVAPGPDLLYRPLIAVLGTIALFAFGYGIHMRLLGGDPRRTIKGRISYLDRTLKEMHDRLWYFQTVSQHRRGAFPPLHMERLGRLESIVHTVEATLGQVKRHFGEGSDTGLLLADEILQSEVSAVPNFMAQVIDREPLPDAPLDVWISRAHSLDAAIESELRKKRLVA